MHIFAPVFAYKYIYARLYICLDACVFLPVCCQLAIVCCISCVCGAVRCMQPVVEYVGTVIRNVVSDKLEALYEMERNEDGSCYMFRLDENFVVDATRRGSDSRFINHSCAVCPFHLSAAARAEAAALLVMLLLCPFSLCRTRYYNCGVVSVRTDLCIKFVLNRLLFPGAWTSL